MEKEQVRVWLNDSNDKGLITDEDYEKYISELNKTDDVNSFWKSIRGKVSGLGGFLSIDKKYEPAGRDLKKEVESIVKNVDVENLSDADKRTIIEELKLKNTPENQAMLDGILDQIWNDRMDEGIDLGIKEEENRQIEAEHADAKSKKDRAETIENSPTRRYLGNEYANKRYIEGAPAWEVALNEAGGILGEAANFVPTTAPYGIGIAAGALDPAIKAAQRFAYTPGDEYNAGAELVKLGRDIAMNEATGLVKPGKAAKKTGDKLADVIGLSGPQGKAVGDIFEEKVKKLPKSQNLTTYALRKGSGALVDVGGANETEKAIKTAKQDYNATKAKYDKQIANTKKMYSRYWLNGEYLPSENDSEITKIAYKEWVDEQKGE
jgi:hypothetical protein